MERKCLIISRFVCLTVLFPALCWGDLTFFVSSDPHYGRSASVDNEAVNKQAIDDMNALPGVVDPHGFVVEEPRGVLVPGDLTGEGNPWDWTGYWLGRWRTGFISDYGVNGEGRLKWPVYEGYGNHDIRDSTTSPVLVGVYLRNKLLPTPLNLDPTELHYSWDWDGIHFVNLNLYPGNGEGAYNSLQFLIDDLATHVGDSNRPVILYYHYNHNTSMRWWTAEERQRAAEAMHGYNVIAIFVGHSHRSQHYVWADVDVYNPPSVRAEGTYFVVRISENRICVCERSPDQWGRCWHKDFQRESDFDDVQ